MKTFILALIAAAILGGCAEGVRPGVRPHWTLASKDFAAIKPAETTKADVERMLGKPLLVTVFRNLNEEVWDYRYVEGAMPYAAEVHFDMQGRATYLVSYRDNCPFAPVGCR